MIPSRQMKAASLSGRQSSAKHGVVMAICDIRDVISSMILRDQRMLDTEPMMFA